MYTIRNYLLTELTIIFSQVKQKDTDLYAIESDIKEKRARVEAMSEHMKNVQQELTITQNLVAARLKEVLTEDHLRMISEREQGRYNLLVKRKNVDIGEIKDRQNTHENNMFRYTQKIEQIKQQMKWSQKVFDFYKIIAVIIHYICELI